MRAGGGIRSVRRIAFYGYLASGNLGNDASFETVLYWCQVHCPDIELHCITIAPDAVRNRYGISAEPLAWRPRSESPHHVIQILQRLGGRTADLIRTFRLAGCADAVIVPGMGVLESSLGTKPWGLPAWLFTMSLACRLRGRPLVLLDVGADLAPNRIIRWLQVATVGLAAHVSYRDDESADAMRVAGAREPDAVSVDLAFAHPSRSEAEAEPLRIVIGVMAYYGLADDPVKGASVRRTYVAALARAVTELLNDGYKVTLVGGDSADEDVAEQLRDTVLATAPEVAEVAVTIRRCTTFAELAEEMARAHVVIGSRFHNVICALRVGRPVISVAYAAKHTHLMSTFGLADYCQDIADLDSNILTAQVRRASVQHAELTEHIQALSARSANRAEQLMNLIGGTLLVSPDRVNSTSIDHPGAAA